jgi:peroxiredoxin
MFLALVLMLQSLFPTGKEIAALSPARHAMYEDSLTVYVFLADECVISQFFTIELERLYNMYRTQDVGFVGVFPNTSSTPEKIDGFAEKFGLTFPMQMDHDKAVTKKFGITITPEVAVYDHRENRLIYRGRIDDSYVRVGKRKLHPQSHDLREIIDRWLLNDVPDAMVKTQAIGCFISFVNLTGQGSKGAREQSKME